MIAGLLGLILLSPPDSTSMVGRWMYVGHYRERYWAPDTTTWQYRARYDLNLARGRIVILGGDIETHRLGIDGLACVVANLREDDHRLAIGLDRRHLHLLPPMTFLPDRERIAMELAKILRDIRGRRMLIVEARGDIAASRARIAALEERLRLDAIGRPRQK